ncbi:hypothetical protein SISSUDRAFT_1057560 [Sistotremastrum suecicum HHB10207 ss-3]|uniref:Uncharacterized protein n=1 Tax=Sistotremastrum suecicum HHB10207 ss-3 TaxID=1314776 RepID=A0A166IA30_9AGAM|nr:hypothetical protein SISSUDRAFT_1057560 [Sistotremastrum suecicum HHB10207 ss-3]
MDAAPSSPFQHDVPYKYQMVAREPLPPPLVFPSRPKAMSRTLAFSDSSPVLSPGPSSSPSAYSATFSSPLHDRESSYPAYPSFTPSSPSQSINARSHSWRGRLSSLGVDDVPALTSDASEISEYDTREYPDNDNDSSSDFSEAGPSGPPSYRQPRQRGWSEIVGIRDDADVAAAAEALLSLRNPSLTSRKSMPDLNAPSPSEKRPTHLLGDKTRSLPIHPSTLEQQSETGPLQQEEDSHRQHELAGPIPSPPVQSVPLPLVVQISRPITPPLHAHLKRAIPGTPPSSSRSPSASLRRPSKKARQSPSSAPSSPLLSPQRGSSPVPDLYHGAIDEPQTTPSTGLDSELILAPIAFTPVTPKEEPPQDKEDKPKENSEDRDPLTEALAELEGHLISTLALSRTSSMAPSSLLRSILEAQPHMLRIQSKKEWLPHVKEVLERGCGEKCVFGRIRRTGTDAASRKLEDQYYYAAEYDPDPSRAELLQGLMPKKRAVTKHHLQYYYEPVGKGSRWDPEDM